MDIMRSVDIKNPEVIELLDEWVQLAFQGKPYNEFDKNRFLSVGHTGHHQAANDRNDYISDEHRDYIISMGTSHSGFPESGRFFDMRKASPKHFDIENVEGYTLLDQKMQTTLATRGNALASVYPPGGFISWHNNANAPSYNLIITWSENGDGYWKHVDPHTGETIVVPDKPGWQCKAFYFGAYADDPENLVYHMASTDCWRITCSYIFDRVNKQFWEDIIEEIETP
jgi:hypothetical protein